MAFKVVNPDFNKSSYTGMTRDHWFDSAKYLLGGVFQYVTSYDAPIIFPKQFDTSYPQPGDPLCWFRAEKYEGLTRTFMLASPVINEFPDIQMNNINLCKYYSSQILRSTDPKSDNYVFKGSELAISDGFKPYQQTVESAALVIGLMDCRVQIWDKYSESERDQIADLLIDYSKFITVGNNWRFFNVLILTFLKINGYKIEEDILIDHLQNLMAFYSGDGWYRDNDNFDFYNVWAFQFYGPIWCSWYGYENEPELAQIIESSHNDLIKTYGMMFSKDSHAAISYCNTLIFEHYL